MINNNECTMVLVEGIEQGVFFRKPIRKIEVGFYSMDNSIFDGNHIFNEMLKPISFTGMLHRVLNGLSVNKCRSINEDISNGKYDGYMLKTFATPIVFRRNFKRLDVGFNNSFISCITSSGYDYDDISYISGECSKEVTEICYRTGETKTLVNDKSYEHTYKHIIKERYCEGYNVK